MDLTEGQPLLDYVEVIYNDKHLNMMILLESCRVLVRLKKILLSTLRRNET